MPYFYIIQEREFIRLKEETYFLGNVEKYEDVLSRHPRGSEICLALRTVKGDFLYKALWECALARDRMTIKEEYGPGFICGALEDILSKFYLFAGQLQKEEEMPGLEETQLCPEAVVQKAEKVTLRKLEKKMQEGKIGGIKYVSFGSKPLTRGIDTETVLDAMKLSCIKIVPYITKLLHGNPELPENHNIYMRENGDIMIREMKNKTAQWRKANGQEVYPVLFLEAYELIREADSAMVEQDENACLTPEQTENLTQLWTLSYDQKDTLHTKTEFTEKIDKVLRDLAEQFTF